MTDPEEQFRSNMVTVRLAKGMTQRDLADAAGLGSREQVARIELGISGIPLGRAVAIAKVFGVSLDVLCEPVVVDVRVNIANGSA